jgi:hypothetical protein
MKDKNKAIDMLLDRVRWPLPPADLQERILMKVGEEDISFLPPFIIPLRAAMDRPAWRTAILVLIVATGFCAGIFSSQQAGASDTPFYTGSGFILTQLFTDRSL